jgi:DsbC/DsbD-like thiol-disulfide interchange protein
MLSHLHLNVVVCLSFVAASPAVASSSAWIETQGGNVRLVSAGEPGPDGRLRGVLEVALKPGWKTYWRDPGDAGVPPRIDVSASTNVSGADIDFPAPSLFDDGYSVWAGYDRPVRLPVTFTIPAPERFAFIKADLFLGICQTICIPVSGEVMLDPGSAPHDPADVAIVSSAFAALPSPAHDGFGISAVRVDDTTLLVQASLPAPSTQAQLFVAGNDRWTFGRPEAVDAGPGKAIFKAPVLGRRDRADAGQEIHYTLVAGGDSVSGTFELPSK